jgi:asparagine synthase (glutamine-hydrolysing)
MTAALVHRGPDSGGVTALGPCVLGHRRLRVVDLATGEQPVRNEDGTVTAVFNGELYDFRHLREELAAAGHDVPGTGDTAILPHLYEEHGLAFPERIAGMFAVALWDAPHRRLVLVRDRVGKKPLLWTQLPDGSLAFASELKSLLRHPEVSRDVDPAAIDAYLALQYVPGSRTALAGVYRLPPGHLLVWEDGRVDVRPWWRLRPADVGDGTDEELLERVRDTVRAAVRRRLLADVPLGALLSGGIDSTIVVGLMAEAASGPVRTFTVGTPDARYDERGAARIAARAFGTDHEEIEVDPDPASLLSRLAWMLDEPLGDEAILPTLLISEEARRHVTVALAGDGGDESFAGYERYAAMRLAARARVPRPAARAGARAARALPGGRRVPRSTAFRAARLLEAAAVPPGARYGALVEVFPVEARRRLYSPELSAAVGAPAPAAGLLGPPPVPGTAGLQRLDAATYLPGDLLPKADLASMAASLELRSPFLDHTVLELGIALPERLLLDGRRGKVALRRAFAGLLPPELERRPKTGFGIPLGEWFRGPLREAARDLLLDARARERGQLRPEAVEHLLADHLEGRADNGHRLWCLLVLELWQRSYLEAPGPPAAPADMRVAAALAPA